MPLPLPEKLAMMAMVLTHHLHLVIYKHGESERYDYSSMLYPIKYCKAQN